MITMPTESVRRRISRTLFTTQGLFTGAFIISFTLTPIIAVELTGQESAAGLPATINLIGRAAVAYPVGWMMDRIGRRYGFSLGYVSGILGMAVSVWGIVNGSFAAFMLGSLMAGMMRGAVEQGRFAAAEVYPSERRSRVIGTIVFAGTFGSIFGPLLVAPSGQAVTAFGLPESSGPYVLAGLLLAACLLITFALLRPDPLVLGRQVEQAESSDNKKAPAAARQLRVIFGSGATRLALLALVIGQLVMTLLMVITPLHMDHLNHNTQAISYVIMAHTLGMFGLSGVTGRLIVRFGRRTMIGTGALVLVAACLLTPFAESVPLLAISLFLLGLGWNFSFVAGSTLLTDSIQANERGKAQGASEVIVALASGTGSLTTGSVFFFGGILAVAGLGLALVLFLAVVLAASVSRKDRPVSSTSAP
jgi:MFS family permease